MNTKNVTSKTENSDEERIVLRMRRGQYVGLGCPNPNKRFREEDVGFGYTHEAPARSIYRDEQYFDDNGNALSREVYEDGELVQLWPVLEHEREHAQSLAAHNKRHTLSFKEAKRHADKMVKDGIAERVHVVTEQG
jgi:hypothetical protein